MDRLPDGLDTVVHERGQSLSSGERQLIALARAFLAQPRVLVLDEATSNLDLQSETKIEAALDVLLEGRTAILIAHRLSTAMRADRIVVVDDGRIVEIGSHDELVAPAAATPRCTRPGSATPAATSGGGDVTATTGRGDAGGASRVGTIAAMVRRVGSLFVVSLLAVALAACSSSPAASHGTTTGGGGTTSTSKAPLPAGPTPSDISKMVCAAEAQREIAQALGVVSMTVRTPTWSTTPIHACSSTRTAR